MKISLSGADRYFDAILHAALTEKDENGNERIVYASFMGVPEAVRAISAGIVEGRPVNIRSGVYTRFQGEHYRFLIKSIGLGDVAHAIVFHAQASMDGVQSVANAVDDDVIKSYCISYDQPIQEAINEQIMQRFQLPTEWRDQYTRIFNDRVTPLNVVINPDFGSICPNMQAVRINLSENMVTERLTEQLQNGYLTISKGKLMEPGIFRPDMTLKEYILKNMKILAKKFQAKKPLYVQGMPLNPAIAGMSRIPFPAQAYVVQGIINAMKTHPTVFCNGDMGTGKTTVAGGVISVLHTESQRQGTAILISAPSITLPKWKDQELREMFPQAKVTILRHANEALHLLHKIKAGYKPHGLEIYLVSLDRAKLGHEPYFSGIWKRLAGSKFEYAWHCPDCFQPLRKKDEDGETYIPLEWEDIAQTPQPTLGELLLARFNHELLPNGLPKSLKVKWKRNRRYMECNDHLTDPDKTPCSCKLWRPAVRSRGETINRPRWNMSGIIRKMKGFFDLYIADEVHQAKAEDSGRGDAFGQLASVAPKHLLLTGTLTTGRSSSIKEILWRTTPRFLLQQGFDNKTSAVKWAKRYGRIKTIYRHEEQDNGWVTRQKKKAMQPVEEPGISPQLTVQLLDRVAFLELQDMGLPLVEYKENVEIISMDPDHGRAYQQFHSDLYHTCLERTRPGSTDSGKAVWSKFIPATIGYADRPDLGGHVAFISTLQDEKIVETIEAPAFKEQYFHPKERRLVEIVRQNLSEGRGCMIYNHYTGRGGMNQRTLHVLKSHGIDAVILDEPNTDKRSERLAELERQGVKVIICNMKLVEVGLDLFAYPTIIFNQLSYDINVVRQASRRAWRIGQHRECRVYFLVYEKTQQMAQFLHLARLRAHALIVEGRTDKSQFADFVNDEQTTLVNDIASCIGNSGLADIWKTMAATELEGIEIIGEAGFKQAIKERMHKLANDTRKLCGLATVEPIKPNSKKLDASGVLYDIVVDRQTEEGQLAFNF